MLDTVVASSFRPDARPSSSRAGMRLAGFGGLRILYFCSHVAGAHSRQHSSSFARGTGGVTFQCPLGAKGLTGYWPQIRHEVRD